MPRRLQLEGAVGGQSRLDAVDGRGVLRARLQHVEIDCRLDGALEVRRAGAKGVGQRQQNPPNFLDLLLLERHDVVVDFHRAERLEEQTRAARRRPVHDARNRPAMLGLDDDHVAAVPLGDHLILQILRRLLAAQIRFERRPQPRPLLAEPFADELQLRARVIDDVAGRIDLLARLRRLGSERGSRTARRVEQWMRARSAANRDARIVDRIEERGQCEQPERLERPPLHGQSPENLRQLARRVDRHRATRRQEPHGLGGRGEQLGDFERIDGGLQAREALRAHRRQPEVLDGLDDTIEFEGPQGAWLHKMKCSDDDRAAMRRGTSYSIACRAEGKGKGQRANPQPWAPQL